MAILTRSIFAPVEIDPDDISTVYQTMEEYRITAQYSSDYGFLHKTASAVKIHHQTYADLRKKTRLPSQLIYYLHNSSVHQETKLQKFSKA
ncbi:MAG: hypothetical protein ACXADH_11350 [Candidatus Kariarchaeaceae archaeon]